MATKKTQQPVVEKSNRRTPPIDQEAHDRKMISLATRQAEKELSRGTASSQIVTFYLQQGAKREALELERMALDIKLTEAKIEAASAAGLTNEMYESVLTALKSYTVNSGGG